jgi:hypothetical protein
VPNQQRPGQSGGYGGSTGPLNPQNIIKFEHQVINQQDFAYLAQNCEC